LWGVIFGILTLLAYHFGNQRGGHETARTMAFCVLAVSQLFHVFNLRSSRSVFVTPLHTNWYMPLAFLFSSLILALLLFVPGLHTIFHLTHMTGRNWLAVCLLAFVPVVISEGIKLGKILLKKVK